MEPANVLVADFLSPCGEFKVTFEDDGKVAYAYLKKGTTIEGSVIVGDVWLYNRCAAPEHSEWHDPRNIPFANRKEFTRDDARFDKAVALEDIRVEWQYPDGHVRALVYLFGSLVALVGINDKPGYCRFASRDGPLAKVLVAERDQLRD